MSHVEAVKAQMRRWGWKPKCSAPAAEAGPGQWIMVYENPFGPASKRWFLGAYSGETELYRTPFESDLAARKEFERRACGEASSRVGVS